MAKNRKFFHILNERARKKERGQQEEEQFKLEEKYEKLYDQHHAVAAAVSNL